MRKIKKFKINCRVREVLRILKSTLAVAEITPQLEEAVIRESQRLHELVSPAAVYETQPREKLVPALVFQSPPRWVAASLFLVTIGEAVEAEILSARERNEEMMNKIVHAIALEALDQSSNFVYRLISSEAKDENCEISRRSAVTSDDGWAAFSAALPGDKIGVQTVGAGRFQPLYSTGGLIYWTPVRKRGSR